MSIIRLALELFALYVLYKLVFDFIIPIAQTTKKVKKQFGEMQNQMNEQRTKFTQKNDNQYNRKENQSSTKAGNDDYIEFEEVK